MKPFVSNCMTTTLPTMPHRNALEACRLVLKYFPEVPCIPRLSRSIRMYMDGVPCLEVDTEKRSLSYDLSRTDEIAMFYERFWAEDVDYFSMNPKHASVFYTFVEMIKERPQASLKMVHTQMPGIVTWALSLKDIKTGRPAWYDETMKDILIKSLVMKAKWQAKMVHDVAPGVRFMVTLGEPSIGMSSSAFGSIMPEDMLSAFNELFRSIDAISCVHCCSNMDWSLLLKSSVQVINFDAFKYCEKLELYPLEIENYLQKNGTLAWGITPVSEENMKDVDEGRLITKLKNSISRLVSNGVGGPRLLERSMITPSCVTSLLSESQSERVFECTSNIGNEMRSMILGL